MNLEGKRRKLSKEENLKHGKIEGPVQRRSQASGGVGITIKDGEGLFVYCFL